MHKFTALLVAGSLLSLASADAQLAHHYNLTDGVDSVGGSNGTLNGAASFTTTPGTLTTSGANNVDYLSLPASVGTGITGDFSIQVFTTTATPAANFSTLFSFATQPGDNNFLLFNSNRDPSGGATANQTSANFRQGTLTPGEKNVGAGSALLGDGLEHDLLLTYVAGTGLVSIYNNGTLAGTGNIGAGFRFDLAAAGPNNGINGHNPFNDVSYNGSTDDFRIYSQALTSAQARTVDLIGANASDAQIRAAIPEPSAWMAALVGVGALFGVQRFRRSVA